MYKKRLILNQFKCRYLIIKTDFYHVFIYKGTTTFTL